MSDEQYYYLLDGKEHGPFSRAAIKWLMASGTLKGTYFLRTSGEMPWQSSEEMGLGEQSAPSGHEVASLEAVTGDPASLVFRPKESFKRKRSSAPIILALLVLPGAYAWTKVAGDIPSALTSFRNLVSGQEQASTTRRTDLDERQDEEHRRLVQEAADRAAEPKRDTARQDPCDELVEQIIGPIPTLPQHYDQNARSLFGMCTSRWSSYERRLRQQCEVMKYMARQAPQDGSPQSLAMQAVMEREYNKAFAIGGEYYTRMNPLCM